MEGKAIFYKYIGEYLKFNFFKIFKNKLACITFFHKDSFITLTARNKIIGTTACKIDILQKYHKYNHN